MWESFGIEANAKRILLDGLLLDKTKTYAKTLSHGYEFAERMIEEIALIFAGQAIKSLNIGVVERGFSHAAFYASHGFGKDFTWSIATKSGIFPIEDPINVTRLDNITEAALTGTVSETEIVLPITSCNHVVFVGEYSTLMRGPNADTLQANMRSLLETGEYFRRLAKVAGLKEIIDNSNDYRRQRLLKEIENVSKKGMQINVDLGEIHIRSSTSWIISSARFGSSQAYGKPLLSLGDIDRYRWRSHLPNREERIRITSEIGSLPPSQTDTSNPKTISNAWKLLFNTLRRSGDNGLKVPDDNSSYQLRKRAWDDTQKQLVELYPNMDESYIDQLINLRATGEFRRLLYQHAALKQFERDQGYDLAEPSKFIIDYDEDGEFARRLWLTEYAPSIMDVVDDINRFDSNRRTKRASTSTQKGQDLILKRLEKGSADHSELLTLIKNNNVGESLFNNYILPELLKSKICKPTGYKVYQIRACEKCMQKENCKYNC